MPVTIPEQTRLIPKAPAPTEGVAADLSPSPAASKPASRAKGKPASRAAGPTTGSRQRTPARAQARVEEPAGEQEDVRYPWDPPGQDDRKPIMVTVTTRLRVELRDALNAHVAATRGTVGETSVTQIIDEALVAFLRGSQT